MYPLTRLWFRETDWIEKVFDVIIVGGIAICIAGLTHAFVVLHDPVKAAAFDPCQHSKVHKRPAHCAK